MNRVLVTCLSSLRIGAYTPPQFPQTCFSCRFFSPHNMHQFTDLAIKAILKDWNSQKYCPPYTDVYQWIDSIELLCTQYGIPNAQWTQCALHFIKEDIGTVLSNVLAEVRKEYGPMDWNRFKIFLITFDGKLSSIAIGPPLTWAP